MNTRVRLAGVALAATLLAGGTATAATAQAAPASSESATASSTAVPEWIYVGNYPSKRACVADGRDYAGSFRCVPWGDGSYDLYVWV
ncbi:hypothetical protein ACFWAT_29480 [Streptomyces syringium]|uniref:hypothetical protein n=1 Tax=Streptomyces syringium TaxID=76729 RepID=UPI00365295CB